MQTTLPDGASCAAATRDAVAALFPILQGQGYQIVGPTLRDGAITCDVLEKFAELPAGWTDEQSPGRYRLKKRDDSAMFGYNVGPQGWKRYLHPPELKMFEGTRDGESFCILKSPPPPVKRAFFGVRPCELVAIERQDRIFLSDRYLDPGYRANRQNALIIAVNCTQSAGTCFCTAMHTGPEAHSGFDLCLTELAARGVFLIESGSQTGAELLAQIDHRAPTPEEMAAADEAIDHAARNIERTLNTEGLRDLLFESFEHPRWDHVAARCLSCANCTLVCPTCFCTTVEDVTDVTGNHAERWRKWDSCFTDSFSYIHGGSVRLSVKSRYRQWLTHKLAAWVDQFGTSGCVGCGRCITWCPGRIDITEEVAALRGAEPVRSGS